MIKQLAIFIENQQGSLRKVTASLHEKKIGIYAFSTIDTPEFGILRMIVSDPDQAKDVLEENGFVARICEVIAVEMTQQETMDALLEVIHEGNVNINYTYSSFGSVGNGPVMILHSDDLDEAENMLKSRGFSCLSRILA